MVPMQTLSQRVDFIQPGVDRSMGAFTAIALWPLLKSVALFICLLPLPW
jgi:hypothetical protein